MSAKFGKDIDCPDCLGEKQVKYVAFKRWPASKPEPASEILGPAPCGTCGGEGKVTEVITTRLIPASQKAATSVSEPKK